MIKITRNSRGWLLKFSRKALGPGQWFHVDARSLHEVHLCLDHYHEEGSALHRNGGSAQCPLCNRQQDDKESGLGVRPYTEYFHLQD